MRYYLYILSIAFLPYAAHAQSNAASTHWTYDGDGDSEDAWSGLSPDYAACDNGHAQSPVGINYTVLAPLPPLQFAYHLVQAEIRHGEHAIVIDIPTGNSLTIGKESWPLTQIVLHSPSEHIVKGVYHVVEIQLVHRNNTGKMLIVSVFADSGESNKALQAIMASAPQKLGEATGISFEPTDLLPKELSYYAYSGSLTAPPCTEGVEWRVLKTPIQLSHDSLLQLGKLTGRNARQPQPVYMRVIQESE